MSSSSSPSAEEQVARLNRIIAGFAAEMEAIKQRIAAESAALQQRERDLDAREKALAEREAKLEQVARSLVALTRDGAASLNS